MGNSFRKKTLHLAASLDALSEHPIAEAIVTFWEKIFFVLAGYNLATLWMAVFADMGASLIVVINGLRLINFNDKAQA